jgi:hypothetical protein
LESFIKLCLKVDSIGLFGNFKINLVDINKIYKKNNKRITFIYWSGWLDNNVNIKIKLVLNKRVRHTKQKHIIRQHNQITGAKENRLN